MYAFFGGGTLLLVILGSLFISIKAETLLGVGLILLNALVLMRAPIHPMIRALKRDHAMRLGAALHLAGFFVTALGTNDLDAGFTLLFGFIPAAILFLGSYAMRRTARI